MFDVTHFYALDQYIRSPDVYTIFSPNTESTQDRIEITPYPEYCNHVRR
jgi:hypothetical protein